MRAKNLVLITPATKVEAEATETFENTFTNSFIFLNPYKILISMPIHSVKSGSGAILTWNLSKPLVQETAVINEIQNIGEIISYLQAILGQNWRW